MKASEYFYMWCAAIFLVLCLMSVENSQGHPVTSDMDLQLSNIEVPPIHLREKREANKDMLEYIIVVEMNVSQLILIERIKGILESISFPLQMDNTTELNSINITTVCTSAENGYNCMCEDGYVWPDSNCIHNECKNINDDSPSCNCISGFSSGGQMCVPETVCRLNGTDYQCRCENQYFWPCEKCAEYDSCDNVTNGSCSCINALQRDGHFCQIHTSACPSSTTTAVIPAASKTTDIITTKTRADSTTTTIATNAETKTTSLQIMSTGITASVTTDNTDANTAHLNTDSTHTTTEHSVNNAIISDMTLSTTYTNTVRTTDPTTALQGLMLSGPATYTPASLPSDHTFPITRDENMSTTDISATVPNTAAISNDATTYISPTAHNTTSISINGTSRDTTNTIKTTGNAATSTADVMADSSNTTAISTATLLATSTDTTVTPAIFTDITLTTVPTTATTVITDATTDLGTAALQSTSISTTATYTNRTAFLQTDNSITNTVDMTDSTTDQNISTASTSTTTTNTTISPATLRDIINMTVPTTATTDALIDVTATALQNQFLFINSTATDTTNILGSTASVTTNNAVITTDNTNATLDTTINIATTGTTTTHTTITPATFTDTIPNAVPTLTIDGSTDFTTTALQTTSTAKNATSTNTIGFLSTDNTFTNTAGIANSNSIATIADTSEYPNIRPATFTDTITKTVPTDAMTDFTTTSLKTTPILINATTTDTNPVDTATNTNASYILTFTDTIPTTAPTLATTDATTDTTATNTADTIIGSTAAIPAATTDITNSASTFTGNVLMTVPTTAPDITTTSLQTTTFLITAPTTDTTAFLIADNAVTNIADATTDTTNNHIISSETITDRTTDTTVRIAKFTDTSPSTVPTTTKVITTDPLIDVTTTEHQITSIFVSATPTGITSTIQTTGNTDIRTTDIRPNSSDNTNDNTISTATTAAMITDATIKPNTFTNTPVTTKDSTNITADPTTSNVTIATTAKATTQTFTDSPTTTTTIKHTKSTETTNTSLQTTATVTTDNIGLETETLEHNVSLVSKTSQSPITITTNLVIMTKTTSSTTATISTSQHQATNTAIVTTIQDTYRIGLSMKINGVFDTALTDKTSTTFKEVQATIEKLIDQSYRSMSGYQAKSAIVNGFRSGSVIVDFSITTNSEELNLRPANQQLVNNLRSSGFNISNDAFSYSVGDGLYKSKDQIYPGQNLTLTCNTRTNKTIKWTRNGIELKGSDRYIINQTRLIVKNTTPDDSGQYECRTTENSLPFVIWQRIVIPDPNIQVSSDKYVKCDDSKILLQCCVQENYDVKWNIDPAACIKPSTVPPTGCILCDYKISTQDCKSNEKIEVTCQLAKSDYKAQTMIINTVSGHLFDCNDDVFGPGNVDDVHNGDCDGDMVGYQIAKCNSTGKWHITVKNCVLHAIQILKYKSSLLVPDDLPQFMANLSTATETNAQNITTSPTTIVTITAILKNIVNISQTVLLSKPIMTDFLKTLDVVGSVSAREAWLDLNQNGITKNASSELLKSIESVAHKLPDETFEIITNSSHLKRTTITVPFFEVLGNESTTHINIPIISKQSFITLIAFTSLDNVLPVRTSYNNGSNNTNINGDVAVIEPESTIDNISLTFTIKNTTPGNHQCVFFNFDLLDGIGGWDSTGCELKAVGNEYERYTCECNHTTSFSILMSPYPAEEIILDYITYIGVAISMASLVLCLIIEAVIWRAVTRNDTSFMRHVAMVNIAFSLLIANICFIVGAAVVKYEGPCSTATFFMHFSYLALFFWMLLSALLLLYRILMVFSRMTKGAMLAIGFTVGYGAPLIIAVVTVAVTAGGKGYIEHNVNCWLNWSKTKALLAFVIPALSIVAINLLVLIIVLFKMVRRGVNASTEPDEKHPLMVIARCVAILTPLFGLTWGFGIGTMATVNHGIHVIFAFLNSLQGFFILLFGTLLDSKAREALTGRLAMSSINSRSTSAGPSSSRTFWLRQRDVYRIAEERVTSSSSSHMVI